jgi:ABC-type glycerol-3-phosphate transport system substrate-binding protein
MEPLWQEVLTGKMTAEDFMDKWATEFEAAYAETRLRKQNK